MAIIPGQPVTAAVVNAEFASKVDDSAIAGKYDFSDTTDSTATTNGSVHLAGGLGVEKKAHINQVFIDSLVGSKALVSSASKEITESAVTSTELGYLSGVTSALQGQIDAKPDDGEVVHVTGTETIAGVKTFSDDANFQQDVVIDGNLTVNGTTTTINTANLEVEDANIVINNGGNDATAEGAGLEIERAGTSGSLKYQDSLASKFKIGALGSEYEILTTGTTQSITGEKTFNNININAELMAVETVDSSSTGNNAVVPSPTINIRLTNASLLSIANIDNVHDGKIIIITNKTGNSVVIKNDSGGTASKRILTGTGSNLTLADDASLLLSYCATGNHWQVIGGSGSGGGIQSVADATARLALSPTNGDIVFQLDTNEVWAYNNSQWLQIGGIERIQSIVSSAGTSTLTSESPLTTIITGSTTHTVKLPNATTLPVGKKYYVLNRSTGAVDVNDNGNNLVGGMTSYNDVVLRLTDNSSANGVWDFELVFGWIDLTADVYNTLPEASGGTNQSTYATGDILYASAANTLSKRSAGTNGYVLTMVAGVPDWAASSGGTVTNVTASSPLSSSGGSAPNITLGTVGFGNGGTGQTTQQAAIDALAGAVTSGQYLRGNGTNVVMSSIQAGDVPTLNQNTTGTASNVTGIVAKANGGSGQDNSSLSFPSTGTISTDETGGKLFITSVQTVTASGTVTTSQNLHQLRYVKGSSGGVTASTTPFGSGGWSDGTIIELWGESDADYLDISFNDANYGCVGNFSSISITNNRGYRFLWKNSALRWLVSPL